jgi:hypothetical protein
MPRHTTPRHITRHRTGDGGAFWGAWCQAVLPPPDAMTLPLAWGGPDLGALQHPDIAAGALAQQASAGCDLFGPDLT